MQDAPLPQLYEALNEYFFRSYQEGNKTHIVQVEIDKSGKQINLNVRPIQLPQTQFYQPPVPPAPQADWTASPLMPQPRRLINTVNLVPMKEPSVLEALQEKRKKEEPEEEIKPYTSGLASM